MGRTRKVVGVAAVAAAAVAMTGVAPATAETSPRAEQTAAAAGDAFGLAAIPGGAETRKVTLITGDQVWVTRATDESGKKSIRTRIVPAKRANGKGVAFAQWGSPESFFVVPSDVLPLVNSRVDAAVFDVAGLIDSGASESPHTRVIVSFTGGASGLAAASSAASSKANATEATVLTSANAVALKVPAGKGAGLFDELETASSGRAFVSLDARVKALDTTSMPQIGATKAWKSGYTGKGIKVAVLDTGIDDTHPDLRGQVAAAKDFSGTGSPVDRAGHGTHVASIVAGTGKARGPGMRGVAYEATLLNGKVLDDDGYGYDSDIIKGMEWAAKSGADVINMSLGGGPGNGTGPAEKSIDALSKKYGTVFAIAAGNSGGEGDGLVSSPSTAASAISVAAVDSKNRRAPFSDTGPGRGNGALKPDVAAPGVDILAARAKVDGFGTGSSQYVKLSGTSMAAPHVAGAAALLAQARPDLTGSELKSVLMGGATDRAGNVWEEGTGTINIPASIGMPVIAQEGSLSFGMIPFPKSKARPRVKTIHYKNTGAKPVTLTLKSDVRDAKGGKAKGVKLSKASVTVPAKGTASVRVTLTPTADPLGTYAGAITATPATGHSIRTTLGWTNDVQRFDVTVKAVSRVGKPARGAVTVFNVDQRALGVVRGFRNGEATMRLPAGTYSAGGFLKSGAGESAGVVLGIVPQFTVKGDTRVSLDGRASRAMTAKTPKPATLRTTSYAYNRQPAKGGGAFDFILASDTSVPTWVTPTSKTTIGRSSFVENAALAGRDRKAPYEYQLAYQTQGRVPKSMDHTVKPSQIATVKNTYRSTINGSAAVAWSSFMKGQTGAVSVVSELKVPSVVTSYLVGTGASWVVDAAGPMRGTVYGDNWFSKSFRAAAGSTIRVDYFTGVMSPGAVSSGAAYRYGNELVAYMPTFEDSASRQGNGTQSTRASLAAYVDGAKVAGVKGTELRIPAPKGKNFRLVQQVDRKANWWGWTTSSTGEWTTPLPTENARTLPLMNIQYQLSGMSVSGAMPVGEQRVGLTVSRYTNPKYFRSGLITPKSLKVEFSIDGGKTWKQAKVRVSGKKATATFTPPAPKKGGTSKVSLRAYATDGKGSSVKETMISAYEMSGLSPDTAAGK